MLPLSPEIRLLSIPCAAGVRLVRVEYIGREQWVLYDGHVNRRVCRPEHLDLKFRICELLLKLAIEFATSSLFSLYAHCYLTAVPSLNRVCGKQQLHDLHECSNSRWGKDFHSIFLLLRRHLLHV